jgi:hypothetical protein
LNAKARASTFAGLSPLVMRFDLDVARTNRRGDRRQSPSRGSGSGFANDPRGCNLTGHVTSQPYFAIPAMKRCLLILAIALAAAAGFAQPTFVPFKAKDNFSDANTKATARHSDAVFFGAFGSGVPDQGKFDIWIYIYFSPSTDTLIEVAENSLFPQVITAKSDTLGGAGHYWDGERSVD